MSAITSGALWFLGFVVLVVLYVMYLPTSHKKYAERHIDEYRRPIWNLLRYSDEALNGAQIGMALEKNGTFKSVSLAILYPILEQMVEEEILVMIPVERMVGGYKSVSNHYAIRDDTPPPPPKPKEKKAHIDDRIGAFR